MADSNSTPSVNDLTPKMKLTGTVKQATLSGAIVDLGMELMGWVHISQLKEGRVNNVTDVVSEGQEVSVWVRQVDQKARRIDLTMIEPPDVGWGELEVGQTVKGKVVRLESYGAFVDIGAERPGLIHVSELSDGFVKSPEDVVKVDDDVETRVIGLNRKKGRIDLSIKALYAVAIEDEPEEEEEQVTAFALAYQRALDEGGVEGDEAGAVSTGESRGKRQRQIQDELLSRTLEQHKDREEN